MADTTFVDQVTVIPTEYLNDSNDVVYTALGAVAGAGTITKVQFPATQAASSDANALDDYEEGNWTPAVAGSTTAGTQTYTVQLGRYVKIGKLVMASASIVMSAKDGTTAGNIVITGLPFTVENVSNMNYAGCVGPYANVDLSAGYSQLMCYASPNTTQLVLNQAGDNVAAAAVGAAAIAATTELTISVMFRATA